MAMPASTCNERVGPGTVTYPCTREVSHDGPHYAVEVRQSVRAYERWLAAQSHLASGLDAFQGMPQTTAERYTENPAPLPDGSPVVRRTAHEALVHTEEVQQDARDMVDGLEVLYRDDNLVLKALPDGRYLVEKPDGTEGQPLTPTWIDMVEVSDDAERLVLDRQTLVQLIDGYSELLDQLDDEEAIPASASEANWPPPVLGSVQPVIDEEINESLDVDPVPTKQREGDQGLPVPSGWTDAYTLVISDLRERKQVGVRRYGQALAPFNGRSTTLDAYEEALDLTVYLRTLLTMTEASRDQLIEEVEGVLVNAGQEWKIAETIVDRILDALTRR